MTMRIVVKPRTVALLGCLVLLAGCTVAWSAPHTARVSGQAAGRAALLASQAKPAAAAAPAPTAVIAGVGDPPADGGWYHSLAAPLMLQSAWPGMTRTGSVGPIDRFGTGSRFFDVIVVPNHSHVSTLMAVAEVRGSLPMDGGLGAPQESVVVLRQRVPLLEALVGGRPCAAVVVATPRHVVGAFLTSTMSTFRDDVAVFTHAMESLRGTRGDL
jgi:hypothetical protein